MIPSYPDYQETDIEWIGSIPSDWAIHRLKWSVASVRNGLWGEDADGTENDVICLRVADFDRGRLRASVKNPTMRKVSEKDRAGRIVQAGDLLLEKSGGGEGQPVGAVVLYDEESVAICSNFVARIELEQGMEPSYWCYAHASLYAARVNVRSIKQTSGIQNLDQGAYLDERFPFPSPSEQTAIARFLDRETGKIDDLIAEQSRLIELLKEKRQAVITHAVTKGLNPDAPMKDSGVEWLGEVPAHWSIAPLKRVAKLNYGDALATEIRNEQGKISVFGSNGPIGVHDTQNTSAPVIFVGRKGSCGALNWSDKPGFAIDTVYFIDDTGCRSDLRWLYWMLHTLGLEGTSQDTGVPGLGRESAYSTIIVIPDPSEQADIAEFLDYETTKIDDLIEVQERLSELLKERRQALISAAVTGKIDVRESVIEQVEAV